MVFFSSFDDSSQKKIGDVEILTYFFGPIGVLLFVNIILFASTARQLTCGLWKRDDVKSTTERWVSLRHATKYMYKSINLQAFFVMLLWFIFNTFCVVSVRKSGSFLRLVDTEFVSEKMAKRHWNNLFWWWKNQAKKFSSLNCVNIHNFVLYLEMARDQQLQFLFFFCFSLNGGKITK